MTASMRVVFTPDGGQPIVGTLTQIPPQIWGGGNEPFPGYGLPGEPPGTWGGSGEPFPGWGLPGQPPGIWGPTDPFPEHPMVPPPGEKPPTNPPTQNCKWVYTAKGWFFVCGPTSKPQPPK